MKYSSLLIHFRCQKTHLYATLETITQLTVQNRRTGFGVDVIKIEFRFLVIQKRNKDEKLSVVLALVTRTSDIDKGPEQCVILYLKSSKVYADSK